MLFGKEDVVCVKNESAYQTPDELLTPVPDVVKTNSVDSDFSILVVDDHIGMVKTIVDDLSRISTETDCRILDNHNIYEASTMMAGFSARNFIKNSGVVINYAILDVTLNGIAIEGGEKIELSGIDTAIQLLEVNPQCKIVICTGHDISSEKSIIYKELDKFRSYLKRDDISDIVINKTDNRSERFKEIFCN